MSDLEKLEQTFKEIGLEYEKIEYDIIEIAEYDGEAEYNACIKINNGVGFYNCHCDFYFLEGNFQKHGCWE